MDRALPAATTLGTPLTVMKPTAVDQEVSFYGLFMDVGQAARMPHRPPVFETSPGVLACRTTTSLPSSAPLWHDRACEHDNRRYP